ncbi:hypothetical protein FEM48_Zijuj01G0152200 [Ziziphus jujuba var. spinosa]|uniref:Uncharacterized protein n=1 Tax=Ziziphus jujuba var. spinosa TaxID=714518 RepID=A0A978W200_ZIZJJ|nr:hypothetical protein FEM48_Zijuj01G0152200 [Ziziphus jujuba var. spinosa]
MTWDMKMLAPLQLISRLAEETRDGDTRFKRSPHICGATNEGKLWVALLEGHIEMLSSDHFPTSPELKLLDNGDFLRAWSGISSLQFILPAMWSYSYGKKYKVTLEQLASQGTLQLETLLIWLFRNLKWSFNLDHDYPIYLSIRIPPKVKRQDNLERSIGEEVLDIAEEGVESSEAF